jgi:hypothetical protein
LQPGNQFKEKDYARINSRLSQLDYLQLKEEPEVSFFAEKASVRLNLADRKLSYADFVLGFLPNQSADNELLITGVLDLSLKNLFGRGINTDLKWERYKQESQTLAIEYNHPFPFGVPFQFDFGFDLLKEDSTFSNTAWSIGLSQTLGSYHLLALGFQRFSSNTLNSSNEMINQIPSANVSHDEVTVKHGYKKVRSQTVVQHWFVSNTVLEVGSRLFRDISVSDSLQERSLRVRVGIDLSNNLRISEKFFWYNRVYGSRIFVENLFANEANRMGGINTLRGFNENTFFTQGHIINQSELRIHYDYNGYVYVLVDHGYVESAIPEVRDQYVLGAGIGLSLRTRSGNFRFAYAFGKSDQQEFSSQNAKIHFGYHAMF